MSDAASERPDALFERPIERILVALDASPHSEAALNAAVRLAVDLEAQLVGLFIEDENVLRAARLPFAREVCAFTCPPAQMSDDRVQRQLRYQAERAQYALHEAAGRAEIAYDFQVARGNVVHELLKATQEVDLITIGKTSTRSSRRRLGPTARAVLSRAPVPVLVLRRAFQQRLPLLTYYDGSDAARAALALAGRLARGAGAGPLKVLLPARDQEEIARLRAEVIERHAEAVSRLQIRLLTRPEIGRLAAVMRQEGRGLVVLPADLPFMQDANLQRFLYEIDRPVLVVR